MFFAYSMVKYVWLMVPRSGLVTITAGNSKDVMAHWSKIKNRHECFIVEGAGGISVPLGENYFSIPMFFAYSMVKYVWLMVPRSGLVTITAGNSKALADVMAHWSKIKNRHECFIVEGAGGISVPLGENSPQARRPCTAQAALSIQMA
jgi:dethiobiotin synthetase